MRSATRRTARSRPARSNEACTEPGFPLISTDGFHYYAPTIRRAFGMACALVLVIKKVIWARDPGLNLLIARSGTSARSSSRAPRAGRVCELGDRG